LYSSAQALLGGLQVRVTGAAEPDVGLGVGALGDQLRQRLARALDRHVDLDARGAGEHRLDHVAPLGLHRADHVELAAVLGLGVLLALMACAWLLPAHAADKQVVGPHGGPAALQEAAARAQDGDTIEILPGEYAGGLVLVNRRLTLRGVGDKPR
jgi:hypothetical protein